MASIRRRNGKYQVQIRVGSYSRTRSFFKVNDAKSWARKEEELAEQRRYLGSKYEPRGLAEILVRYLSDVTPHKRSCDTERIVLRALLREDWVNTPLPQLNAAAFAEYRDRRLTVAWCIPSGTACKTDLELFSVRATSSIRSVDGRPLVLERDMAEVATWTS